MNAMIDEDLSRGDILAADDADAPVDAWSLDELERYSDLDSVRAARTHTDGFDG